MTDTNTIVVAGRLFKDAETSKTKNGSTMVRFTLVSGEYSKTEKDNTYPNYIEVVYFGDDKGSIFKGTQVTVYGRLHQDRWEANGQKCSKLKVIADCIAVKKTAQKPKSNGPESFPDEEFDF